MRNKAFYDLIFPDFWEKIDRTTLAQDEHSMFGDSQVFDWLIDIVRPTELIEIGSWKGHSANHMIDVCKRHGLDSKIVCVDTFLGGPEHWVMPPLMESMHRVNGRPTILERFIGNTIARGNEGRVFPLTLDSNTARTVLAHIGFEADLIFVDGNHEPGPVREDILGYYKLLSPEGVMFGDDYQDKGVADTVHACARELGVTVVVSARKWIYVNEALMRRLGPPAGQLRQSFDGWIHP